MLFYSERLVFLYYIHASTHCFLLFHSTLSHIHTHTLMDTPRATWGLVSAPMILQHVIRLIIIIIIIVTCRLEKNQPCILMHSYGLNTTPSTKKFQWDEVVFYKLVTTSGFSLDISGVKFFWERKQDDLAQMYFYPYFYHNLFHLYCYGWRYVCFFKWSCWIFTRRWGHLCLVDYFFVVTMLPGSKSCCYKYCC